MRFRASSAAVATRVPSSFQVSRLDRDTLGAPALRSELFGLVNQGQLIVNYLGHGSTYIWGSSGELLATADVTANWMPTGSRLPFVVAMNCLNGYFQGIDGEESLAETLLRGGGAVAVWASSSLTEAEPQGVMNDELFRLLFSMQGTLGDAVSAAKSGTASSDVRRSWIFFGDPATRLKGLPLAADPPPTLAATPATVNFAVVTSGGHDHDEPEPNRSPDANRHWHRDVDGDRGSTVDPDREWDWYGQRTLQSLGRADGSAGEWLRHRHSDDCREWRAELPDSERPRVDTQRHDEPAVRDDRYAARWGNRHERRGRRHRMGAGRRGCVEGADLP